MNCHRALRDRSSGLVDDELQHAYYARLTAVHLRVAIGSAEQMTSTLNGASGTFLNAGVLIRFSSTAQPACRDLVCHPRVRSSRDLLR